MELGINALPFSVGSILVQSAVAVERAHDSLSGTKDSLSFQKGSNLGVGVLSKGRFAYDLESQPGDANDRELLNPRADITQCARIRRVLFWSLKGAPM
jgi:hypothetical protein